MCALWMDSPRMLLALHPPTIRKLRIQMGLEKPLLFLGTPRLSRLGLEHGIGQKTRLRKRSQTTTLHMSRIESGAQLAWQAVGVLRVMDQLTMVKMLSQHWASTMVISIAELASVM